VERPPLHLPLLGPDQTNHPCKTGQVQDPVPYLDRALHEFTTVNTTSVIMSHAQFYCALSRPVGTRLLHEFTTVNTTSVIMSLAQFYSLHVTRSAACGGGGGARKPYDVTGLAVDELVGRMSCALGVKWLRKCRARLSHPRPWARCMVETTTSESPPSRKKPRQNLALTAFSKPLGCAPPTAR
jgi:hypothetical protein